MKFQELEFSPYEAAYITDLPHKEVQKAVDEGWFANSPKRQQSLKIVRRRFGPAEVTHLYAVKRATGTVIFTADAKKRIHQRLREHMPSVLVVCGYHAHRSHAEHVDSSFHERWPAIVVVHGAMGDAQGQRTRQGNPRADLHIINENFDRRYKAELIADYQKAYATQLKNEPLRIFVSHSDDDHMRGLVSILSTFHKSIEKPLRVPNTPLLLDYATSWREISDRFARALAAQMTVVSDPEIRGGEPVVRGTRIPVSLLHDLVEQGASQEEILADYPALDAERLDLALLYAKTHPRVGRPRKGPWHPS